MKNNALTTIVAVAAVAFAGCAQHPGRIASSQLTGVKVGMTEAEVIQVLGKPQTVSFDSKMTVYRYFIDQGHYIFIYQNLLFTDGKLTSLSSEKPKLGGILGGG